VSGANTNAGWSTENLQGDDRSVNGHSPRGISLKPSGPGVCAASPCSFYDAEQFGPGACLCMLRRRFGLTII